MRNARDVTGLEQERDYLTRAAEAYKQALEHYSRATDFAGVPRNIAAGAARSHQRRAPDRSAQPGTAAFDAEGQPWR